MKRKWSDETMNHLMFEIKNHHVANEIVKLVKKYSINFEKIMKRLQLTIFKCKKKMNRDIRATAVYILNDFKRAHSKIYSDLSASIRKNLRAANLMIKDMRLIENFQANVFLMMILLKASQSLQAESILLKLTLRLFRQEQSFSNFQF